MSVDDYTEDGSSESSSEQSNFHDDSKAVQNVVASAFKHADQNGGFDDSPADRANQILDFCAKEEMPPEEVIAGAWLALLSFAKQRKL